MSGWNAGYGNWQNRIGLCWRQSRAEHAEGEDRRTGGLDGEEGETGRQGPDLAAGGVGNRVAGAETGCEENMATGREGIGERGGTGWQGRSGKWEGVGIWRDRVKDWDGDVLCGQDLVAGREEKREGGCGRG